MKKLALAGIVSILATVALSGCMSVPEEEDTQAPADDTTPVVEDVQEETDITDEAEDGMQDEDAVEDTEEATEEEEGGGGVADKSPDCYTEEYLNSSVSEKLANYEMCSMDFVGDLDMIQGNLNEEAKALNEAMKKEEIKKLTLFSSDSMNLELYKTINDIVNECAQLGSNHALEVTDDYIIWGYPNCTAGLAPSPDSQPEMYADYEDCMIVQDELYELYELE